MAAPVEAGGHGNAVGVWCGGTVWRWESRRRCARRCLVLGFSWGVWRCRRWRSMACVRLVHGWSAPAVRWRWRGGSRIQLPSGRPRFPAGWAACAQRWVAAIAATAAAWLLSLAWVTGTEAWNSFFRWATPLAALLTLGVMTERRLGGWGRPLSALGAASLCAYAALVCLLLEQSAFGGSWTTVEDWELAISAMVAPVVARWALRDEGLFLLLIPGMPWAVHQDCMVVGIGVLTAVGLTVAVQGAITRTWSRAYAGFALASLASLIGFAHWGLLSAWQCLLLMAGVAAIVLFAILHSIRSAWRRRGRAPAPPCEPCPPCPPEPPQSGP